MFGRYHDMNYFCDNVYNVNIANFAYGGRASMIRSSRLPNCFINLWYHYQINIDTIGNSVHVTNIRRSWIIKNSLSH